MSAGASTSFRIRRGRVQALKLASRCSVTKKRATDRGFPMPQNFVTQWSSHIDAARRNEALLVSDGLTVFLAYQTDAGHTDAGKRLDTSDWELIEPPKHWMPLPDPPTG
jgi:hypothetical protein